MNRLNIAFALVFWSLSMGRMFAFELTGLKVEYAETPLGIDVKEPRFSWQMLSDKRGEVQVAYQIVVRNEGGNQVWDSGKITDASSLGIRYGGVTLSASTRYDWWLTVWNAAGEKITSSSWFETGLMAFDDKDMAWNGAEWIGGDERAMPFYSDYLPVFRIRYTVQADRTSKTTQAGFIYGANDFRLMDANMNILGVERRKDESYIKVVLNTEGLDKEGSASLDIYRVGYTRADKGDIPFSSVKVPATLVNKENRYDDHQIEIASSVGNTNVWLNDSLMIKDLNLNPIGKGGDYITFPVLADVGFSVAAGKKASFSNVEIFNYRLPRHTLATVPDTTIDGKEQFVSLKEIGCSMLRTEFLVNKAIKKARIYASARGIYELFLNGKRVSDDYFNPGMTQYNKTLMYQTYDVTSLLKEGNNAWGAILNEGWWSGDITFTPENWNYFGDRQALFAQLIITYTDGSKKTVVTTPKSWKFYNDGPVRYGSLFQGEVYDALREKEVRGWSCAGYESSLWRSAEKVRLEDIVCHEQPSSGPVSWPATDDYSQFRLIAQIGTSVRKNREITAKSVEEVRPGVFVYDMGQNMPGVPQITFSGLKPGTKVRIRYAEVKYPDLPEYKDQTGMIMLENIRSAMAQDIYIAKGGTETYQPRYTYHGYQFVEITGIASAVPISQVKGIILSSVDQITAGYETSNKDLNRFFQNVEWSSLANIFSIPTDCPQRNERMGWSGDLSVFSPAMSYLFNGASFLRRHLLALRDTQKKDGAFAAIAPVGGGFGGTLWESVGIVMPWQSYVQYKDVDALSEHYPSMKKYMQMVLDKYIDKRDNYYKAAGSFFDLGDWLGFEVMKNDNSLLFDCYLVYELEIMSKVASILGDAGEAAYYEKIRQSRIDFINAHYIDPQTCKTIGAGFGTEQPSPFGGMFGPKRKGVLIDTQTSYALPLAFGIVKDGYKAKFIENFIHSITRESIGDDGKVYPTNSLMTGFIGTAWVSLALSDCGYSDVAYQMLLHTDFPSWLYPVTQGATTIWERLNSMTKEHGFGGNNSMNSFNHYAFGSVTNWLIQRSVGIARDEQAPGFKHFILRPEIDTTGKLDFARGYYHSMYGLIESQWIKRKDSVDYMFTIPANTSATVYLPVSDIGQVKESGKSVEALSEIKVISATDQLVVLEIPSGKYHFTVE